MGSTKPGKPAEAEAILARAGEAQLIACDERGRAMTSREFAARLMAAALRDDGVRHLAFAIGGADGLDPALAGAAIQTLSFGPQTWPHALARAMLAERVYRAVTILMPADALPSRLRATGIEALTSAGISRDVRRALAIAALLAATAPAQGAHGQSLDERPPAQQSLTAQEGTPRSWKLGADRNALSRLLSALALFSRDPPPPLLVSPADAKDAVRAMILAKAIAPQLEARARVLSAEAAALTRVRRQAAQQSGDLFAAESALEDRQGRLEAVAADAGLLAPPSVRAAPPAVRTPCGWPPT